MRTEARESIEPHCPFCRAKLERPSNITLGDAGKALGGRCVCGALYLVDPTGKGVGDALMQGLSWAAGTLGKDLGELASGEDYEDAVLSYDWRTHRSTGESTGYMDGYGRLVVVKAKKKT